MMKRIKLVVSTRLWLSLVVMLCYLPSVVKAQQDSIGNVIYSEQRPLVYEDMWDLWPYSFLDDNGEPSGFNVDLIKKVMAKLNIPYVIKLKPKLEAFNDLKEGRADLILGLSAGFHDQYGKYSQNSITLFTQSMVSPKDKPVEIRSFRDLATHQVIVNDSSLVHHLMIDYGWGKNALPTQDLSEAIQRVSANNEGCIVWNTLSLKWLMNRYHTDNLQLTPVNMPHGEYKFMSNDLHLLNELDSVYTELYADDALTPIQNKWFYPEHEEKGMSTWMWYLWVTLGILLVILMAYGFTYFIQAHRLKPINEKTNKRLALILQTSHVRIWTYNVAAEHFEWRNDNGQVAYIYSKEEFSKRYSPEDFDRLMDTIQKLSETAPPAEGQPEEHIQLELCAMDHESGDDEWRDFVIALSVLTRDKNGRPTEVIGTKKDVTEERKHQREMDSNVIRYWNIFYTPMLGIMLFDRNGILVDINPMAADLYGIDPDSITEKPLTINSFIDLDGLALAETDGYHVTRIINLDELPRNKQEVETEAYHGKLYYEYRLMTVDDEEHALLGVFAIIKDVTAMAKAIEVEKAGKEEVEAVRTVRNDYEANINMALETGDIRLVSYSPEHHTLTIFRKADTIQHQLTQTRCMTLVAEHHQRQAMRLLSDMDQGLEKVIDSNITTILRTPARETLQLHIVMRPKKDKTGKVVKYEGVLRDNSSLRAIQHLTELQNEKVQEVENTKNAFVKNMVQEIRTPMSKLLTYVTQLDPKAPAADESMLSSGIQENADYLLHLIDNILYLSRLEARMVEINVEPRNFAELFDAQCMNGWDKFRQSGVSYSVENPYEQLIVGIDAEHLGKVIEQVTANAAQHTPSGNVKARFDYIGRRLMIFIEDTGEGMSPETLNRINTFEDMAANTHGLGLAIAKELVRQMNGVLEISSELGVGTMVFISIPCQTYSMKRKKNV